MKHVDIRVCLLGEYNENLDEGMRKTSYYLSEYLSNYCRLLLIDIRKVFTLSFRKSIKEFQPDIIHYVHGSSFCSFALLKYLSLISQNSKTVLSILHPSFTRIFRHLSVLVFPDLILLQSLRTDLLKTFDKGNMTVLPICGVDTQRFYPSIKNNKQNLREKYGVDKNKFVFLHIGSIKEGRNVLALKKLQRDNNQVIIVAPEYNISDSKILLDLEESGCIVWKKYYEHIEEIYALSDCYVFPTLPRQNIIRRYFADCIELPLSVLEAMACNLPVISTKFGALPYYFKGNDGLFYVENEDELDALLYQIKNDIMKNAIKTRDKVLPFSWDVIARNLANTYIKLMGGQL
jgi:glycosyltransferase involved in cell wall biosynthesis